jgi:hypothetical protein
MQFVAPLGQNFERACRRFVLRMTELHGAQQGAGVDEHAI